MVERAGRPGVRIVLSEQDRARLVLLAAEEGRVGLRAQIILALADGAPGAQVARDLGMTEATVSSWRRRFAAEGVGGLGDVPRPGRARTELVLSAEERDELRRLSQRQLSAQALALRARIVLACAEPGAQNKQVAKDLGCNPGTVAVWRARYVAKRLDGLLDEARVGRPPSILLDKVEQVVVDTLESTPKDATHWSRASMAEHSGLSESTIGRIWRRFELKPHRQDTFKLSTDPQFVAKVVDVVGLYLNPPEKAVVLCVDEKSQIQALDRSQPMIPMVPGTPERITYDYKRNGTSSLFAAFNVGDGTVIADTHRRHRAAEFKKFLITIDKHVPARLEVHIVLDNYATHKTPAIMAWLARHPRFHLHFTPTGSSWLNQVERWFGYLTDKKIRRGIHHTVADLERDITTWVEQSNRNPKPFVWVKSAEEILHALARYLEKIQVPGRGDNGKD